MAGAAELCVVHHAAGNLGDAWPSQPQWRGLLIPCPGRMEALVPARAGFHSIVRAIRDLACGVLAL